MRSLGWDSYGTGFDGQGRERAATTVTIPRLSRRENPHLDGWALDDPVTVHVCEHHRTAPDHRLELPS